jgi:hypothetical protein
LVADTRQTLIAVVDDATKQLLYAQPAAAQRRPSASSDCAVSERELGSEPAYSHYFKQIAKAVVLPRP